MGRIHLRGSRSNKVLSVLFSFVLVTSMLPTAAFAAAADPFEGKDAPQQQAGPPAEDAGGGTAQDAADRGVTGGAPADARPVSQDGAGGRLMAAVPTGSASAQEEAPAVYSFEPNADGAAGEMPVFEAVPGEPAALPPCAFSLAGHVFSGWSTTADGGDAADDPSTEADESLKVDFLADGQEVDGLSYKATGGDVPGDGDLSDAAVDGKVTLYAQWEPAEPEDGKADGDADGSAAVPAGRLRGPSGAKAPANGDATIEIRVVDPNGDPVDASALGGGFDLTYYEVPLNFGLAGAYIPSGAYMPPDYPYGDVSAETVAANLKSDFDYYVDDPRFADDGSEYGSMPYQTGPDEGDVAFGNIAAQYRASVRVTEPVSSLTLNKEQVSSLLYFSGSNARWDRVSVDMGAAYTADGALWYDADSINTYGRGGLGYDAARDVYVLEVVKRPTVTPKVRIVTDTSSYDREKYSGDRDVYPYTLQLACGSSAPVYKQVEVTGPDMEVEMVGEVADAQGDVYASIVSYADGHYAYGPVDLSVISGYMTPLDGGEVHVSAYMSGSLKPVALSVDMYDEYGSWDPEASPVYALATYADVSGDEHSTVQRMGSGYNTVSWPDHGVRGVGRNVTYHMSSDSSPVRAASLEFYVDEGCTQPLAEGIWTRSNDGYLQTQVYGSRYDCGLNMGNAVVMTYDALDVPLSLVSASSNPSVDYPCYAKVTLTGQDGVIAERSVPLEGDASVDLSFEGLSRSAASGDMTLSWGAYADEACTEPMPQWSSESRTVRCTRSSTTGRPTLVDSNGAEMGTVYLSHMAFGSVSLPFAVVAPTDPSVLGDDLPDGVVVRLVPMSQEAAAAWGGADPAMTSVAIDPVGGTQATVTFEAPAGSEFASVTNGWMLAWQFTKDGQPVTGGAYAPGYVPVSLTGNGRLAFPDGNAVGLIFEQVVVEVDPEPYATEVSAASPLNVGVNVSSPFGGAAERVVAFEDASARGIAMPCVLVDSGSAMASAAAMTLAGDALLPGWQSDGVTGTMRPGGTVASDDKSVLKPYELAEAPQPVQVSMPVSVEMPAGAVPSYGTAERVHVMLIDEAGNAVTQSDSLHSSLNGYYSYSSRSMWGYSHHSTPLLACTADAGDGHVHGTVDLGEVAPGTYRIVAMLGNNDTYWSVSMMSDYYYNVDSGWEVLVSDEVTVTDDGTATFADGSAAVAVIGRDERVQPVIGIDAAYPDGFDATAEPGSVKTVLSEYHVRMAPTVDGHNTTGNSFGLYLTMVDKNPSAPSNTKRIPEGASQIGTSADAAAWRAFTDAAYDGDGTYDMSSWTGGVPTVGSFTNQHGGLRPGDYLISYEPSGYSDAVAYWSDTYTDEDAAVHVRLLEDGSVHRVLSDGTVADEPYRLSMRYIGEEVEVPETVKVRVELYAHDGVDLRSALEALGDAEILAGIGGYEVGGWESVMLASGHVPASSLDLDSIADGVLAFDMELQGVPGTFDFTSESGLRLGLSMPTADWWVECEPDSFSVSALPGEAGGVIAVDGEPVKVSAEYLHLPWNETTPGKVSESDDDDAPKYYPIADTSAIVDGRNYIVVARDPRDGKFYAMGLDGDKGYAYEMQGVGSYADLEAGYRLSEADASSLDVVLSASKSSHADGSVSLQFKTGRKDAAGKTVALKMGNSNSELQPLFTGSAGTVTVYDRPGGFGIMKGKYAQLSYMPRFFGQGGFGAVATPDNQSYRTFARMYYGFTDLMFPYMRVGYNPGEHMMAYYGQELDDKAYHAQSSAVYTSDVYRSRYTYMVDVDTETYGEDYIATLPRIDTAYGFPGQFGALTEFTILSDAPDEQAEATRDYTLVKTFGDFEYTFNMDDSTAKDMVLVYKDPDTGKEYAITASGLRPVETKAGSSGYRKLSTSAANEVAPDNNSGTSSRFAFASGDVDGWGVQVMASQYAFRRGPQAPAEGNEYLTLLDGDDGWTADDDPSHTDALLYVLEPSDAVRSRADWDLSESYTLAAYRLGEPVYLGVGDDGAGNLVVKPVASKDDAVRFTVYSSNPNRYYSSAYSTGLHTYCKISSIDEIAEGDELVIVHKDADGNRVALSPLAESGFVNGEDVNPDGYYYYRHTVLVSTDVLDGYSSVDARDPSYPADAFYRYRLETDELEKKPYAYMEDGEEGVIHAQGAIAWVTGAMKSETNKQHKYKSLRSLLNNSWRLDVSNANSSEQNYGYVPSGIRTVDREVNFLPSTEADGEFLIRGGKSYDWLGMADYAKSVIKVDGYGMAWGPSDDVRPMFATVVEDERGSFEIYKRSTTDEMFTVRYHEADGSEAGSEVKPCESFVLQPRPDLAADEGAGEPAKVFVGWSTDPAMAGTLSLDDSANIYDYYGLAHLPKVKDEVRERMSLLGICSRDASNTVDFEDVEGYLVDEDGNRVLDVYPVYALRGYSSAVSADDGDTMIVGISDDKDFEAGGTGVTNDNERWLGSIDVEVYRDGVLWVPGGEGGSTIGMKRGRSVERATVYFTYHNDDAADLNIKFVEDGVTADTLYEYMVGDDFSAYEPTGCYIMNAVWAEQGGSEDGLKYRYNWLDPEHGGQLDNVKGGSTVKIYLTTVYEVKYYLDGGSGWQQLPEPYVDGGRYATPGTDDAVEVQRTTATEFLVEPGGTYYKLVDRTPNNGGTFVSDEMARGEYSEFLYRFESLPHEWDTPALPYDQVPSGKELASDAWMMFASTGENVMDVDAESTWTMTGTSYGTGNTVYAFHGDAPPLGPDGTNTYHLGVRVASEQIDLPFTGMSDWRMALLAVGVGIFVVSVLAIARRREE